MFFIVSKIIGFFIQPLNFSILLLWVALLAMVLRRRKLAGASVATGVMVLMLATWTSLGHLMLSPLENRYPRPDLPPQVDGIVVLGGGLEGAINLARGGYEMNSSGDRYVEAAVLARRFPMAKIVVTGGSGKLLLKGEGDAETALRLFTALGISQDRLILENRSRNTYENAVFTKEMVTPRPGETWLLVTSAFHMPRSKALFDKAGFATVPWPVDYRTSGKEGVGLFVDNAADSLQATTIALREWIGLFAYWLTGKIDSPFPGPA